MKRKERLEFIHGSGNVFRDLKRPDADVKQLKGILAAEIIKMLDRDGLTVRAAQKKTGVAAADLSRIRNVDLARFTVDRLMAIINRLGSRVEVAVKIRRSTARAQAGIKADADNPELTPAQLSRMRPLRELRVERRRGRSKTEEPL